MSWAPTEILTHHRSHPSSTGPIFVETDAGDAVVKALGNPEGPHALACEWVGTSLARLLGLRTFDFHILPVEESLPLPLGKGGGFASVGPAFATRVEKGRTWGGGAESLRHVRNREDISRLIVFDTLVRNRDRWLAGRSPNFDNVFLSSEHTTGEAVEIVAMDHTHCLTDSPDLSPPALRRAVDDPRIFGAFPAFLPHWDETATHSLQDRLDRLGSTEVELVLGGIPPEWEVDGPTKAALLEFLLARARTLARRPATDFQPQETTA